MPAIIIIIFIGYLLGNFYVYIRGLQAISAFPTTIKILVGIVYWVCAMLIIAYFAIYKLNMPVVFAKIIYRIGTGWLVFTLYMVIMLVLFDLVKVFNHSFSSGFVFALVITCSILVIGYIHYQYPNKKVVDVVINKPSGKDIDRLKIVAVSDVHLGYGTDKKALQKYVQLINAENPDIILIGGDLFDFDVDAVARQNMEEELNSLNAPMGIFMTTGNHEFIGNVDKCMDFICRKTKIQILRDSIAELDCGIKIVGRDDFSNSRRLSAETLAKLVDRSQPIIVIDHQPRNTEDALTIGADLQFSGHTHNGQIFPLNLITRALFEVSYGYKKKGDTHFYTSSGLSLWGPPFRIGSNSEYVVIRLSIC